MLKKSLAILMAIAMSVLFFAGCNSSTTATTPAASGTTPKATTPVKDSVKIAVNSDMMSFDPHNYNSIIDETVTNNIFEPLLDFYQGKYTPNLCESYTISSDSLSYTFKIRKGVKFQNGDEMKASDVVYSLKRAKESTQLLPAMKSVDSITATDDSTVVIKLKQIDAPFLLLVCAKARIISEKVSTAASYDIKTQPVGTGPYKLVKWNPGQNVILTRFDDYHGEKPQIKDATYTIITDASSAQMAVESKDIDFTYTINNSAVATLEANKNLTVEKIPTIGCGYLVYNMEKFPFNDLNFRTALTYGVDKETLIKVALNGNGKLVTAGLWNEDTVGYTGNVKSNTFDLAKAKEALAKSKYKGETITLAVRDDDTYKKIATLIQSDLSKVGINIKISINEVTAWITDMTNGNFELSFIVDTFDIDAAKWCNALTTSAIGIENFSRLKSPEVDEWFAKANTVLDLKTRQDYYDKISQYVKDQAVVSPIYYKCWISVHNSALKVSRFYPNGFSKVIYMSWAS